MWQYHPGSPHGDSSWPWHNVNLRLRVVTPSGRCVWEQLGNINCLSGNYLYVDDVCSFFKCLSKMQKASDKIIWLFTAPMEAREWMSDDKIMKWERSQLKLKTILNEPWWFRDLSSWGGKYICATRHTRKLVSTLKYTKIWIHLPNL